MIGGQWFHGHSKKKKSPQGLGGPRQPLDLLRQFFNVFRFVHQRKRQYIDLFGLIGIFFQRLRQLQQLIGIVPEFFLIFFELPFGIGFGKGRPVSPAVAGIGGIWKWRHATGRTPLRVLRKQASGSQQDEAYAGNKRSARSVQGIPL